MGMRPTLYLALLLLAAAPCSAQELRPKANPTDLSFAGLFAADSVAEPDKILQVLAQAVGLKLQFGEYPGHQHGAANHFKCIVAAGDKREYQTCARRVDGRGLGRPRPFFVSATSPRATSRPGPRSGSLRRCCAKVGWRRCTV